jgi:hypothetical protein
VSKKFSEWYQKTKKTEDTNKLTLLAFKIITILHNTLLATFIKLLETVGKGLFRSRSQNHCHTFLDCCHVCKTCAFHDFIQVGKQKEVHPPYSPDLAPTGIRSGEYSGLLINVRNYTFKDKSPITEDFFYIILLSYLNMAFPALSEPECLPALGLGTLKTWFVWTSIHLT